MKYAVEATAGPIQFCAGRTSGVCADTVSDGSRGLYQSRARAIKMARVMPRKPISSLNRRFSVGVSKRTQISRILGKGRTESHRTRGRWSRGSPVEDHQEQNEYTKDDAVNNKDLQRSCLQIAQQKADHAVASKSGTGNADEHRASRHFHPPQ